MSDTNALNWILLIIAGSIGVHWLKEGKRKQQEEYTPVAALQNAVGNLTSDGVSQTVSAPYPVLPVYAPLEDTHGL